MEEAEPAVQTPATLGKGRKQSVGRAAPVYLFFLLHFLTLSSDKKPVHGLVMSQMDATWNEYEFISCTAHNTYVEWSNY